MAQYNSTSPVSSSVGPLGYMGAYYSGLRSPIGSGLTPEQELQAKLNLWGMLTELDKKRADLLLARTRIGREIIEGRASVATAYVTALGTLSAAISGAMRAQAMKQGVGAEIFKTLKTLIDTQVSIKTGTYVSTNMPRFFEIAETRSMMAAVPPDKESIQLAMVNDPEGIDKKIASGMNESFLQLTTMVTEVLGATDGSDAMTHFTLKTIRETVYLEAQRAAEAYKDAIGDSENIIDPSKIAEFITTDFMDTQTPSGTLEEMLVSTKGGADLATEEAVENLNKLQDKGHELLSSGAFPQHMMDKFSDSLLMLEDLNNLTPDQVMAGVAALDTGTISDTEAMLRDELEKINSEYDPMAASLNNFMSVPGMSKLVATMGFTSVRRAAKYMSNPVYQYMVVESLQTIKEMGPKATLDKVRDALINRSSDEGWKFYMKPVERATRIRIHPKAKEHFRKRIDQSRKQFRLEHPNAPIIEHTPTFEETEELEAAERKAIAVKSKEWMQHALENAPDDLSTEARKNLENLQTMVDDPGWSELSKDDQIRTILRIVETYSPETHKMILEDTKTSFIAPPEFDAAEVVPDIVEAPGPPEVGLEALAVDYDLSDEEKERILATEAPKPYVPLRGTTEDKIKGSAKKAQDILEPEGSPDDLGTEGDILDEMLSAANRRQMAEGVRKFFSGKVDAASAPAETDRPISPHLRDQHMTSEPAETAPAPSGQKEDGSVSTDSPDTIEYGGKSLSLKYDKPMIQNLIDQGKIEPVAGFTSSAQSSEPAIEAAPITKKRRQSKIGKSLSAMARGTASS